MLIKLRQISHVTRILQRRMTTCREEMTTQDGRHVVDLRSDTVTRPTQAMKEAMVMAPLGDDVMGEDPTVHAMEDRCCKLFGTEAALLVPSGTMANLIAALVHCQGRFQEVILGDKSHMFLFEVGSLGQFAGVQCRLIPNQKDGTLLLEDIQSHIRSRNDVHQPWTKLICLENTQNFCGGKVLSLEYLSQVKQLARENNLKVHLDGARVFNAATALGVPVSDIVQHVDSVSCCFSKGLACPIGSVIAGSKEFIVMARRARKALGGGMRQAGVIAAPMIVALDTIAPRLHEDHFRARTIAEGIISAPHNKIVTVDVEGVETNIMFLEMIGEITPEQLSERMGRVTEEEKSELGESIIVLMKKAREGAIRLVTHNDVSEDSVQKAIKKFHYVLNELS